MLQNHSKLMSSLLKTMAVLVTIVTLQFSSSAHAASASSVAAVSGDFVYMQESDGSLLQYHVSKVDYQGVEAWEIAWQCDQLTATHYLRISDGKPLYVKRINHALKRTVEITYSQDKNTPTIYRKRSADEFIERKIWNTDLQDLGALPQMLVRIVQGNNQSNESKKIDQDNIKFSAINYDDGKVYPLIAKKMGYRHVKTDNDSIRCAIYDVKLDSWMSSFVSKTRLLIPLQHGSSNFVTYNGPGLDSVGDAWSLRLVGKSSSLAMADSIAPQP
ncbi:hypothetical protein JYT48_00210 [Mariprofundus ferrooxydans]|nr:hypothetical protein [Mariprofundus ferrooxydans]